ncbi:HEXXH motif-containing putative peptide modification protein [Streptomyces sp. NPDC059445]|uniref:aKG-HExxH-type peptide beta-hydroxylase n=1 Tax=Streptomyces sp. NPDC059445 TaxID=3346832 RepID=UPI003675C4EB
MILPAVPDRAVDELGRTEGGPETLGLLVRDQHTRRLLLLRAVLDAAESAAPDVCPAAALNRLRADWSLLEEAERRERSDRPGPVSAHPNPVSEHPHPVSEHPHPVSGNLNPLSSYLNPASPGLIPASPNPKPLSPNPKPLSPNPVSLVRGFLLHPFIGPWARDTLRALGAGTGPLPGRDSREQDRALAHFGALAAAAAARAGVSYAVRLTAHDGVLALPSLGALRTGAPGSGATEVTVVHRRGRLTLRRRGETDVVVRPQSGTGAWSESAAWTSAYTLPGLVPGSAAVPLDDLDPYRTARGGPRPDTLSGPAALDEADRKHWLHTWSGTATALATGGGNRLAESAALLRCMVPLAAPPGSVPGGTGGSCSGTRREAFGAILSSAPATATAFAATLVHEIQHAKLAALSDMVTLHHASPEARHFAPWRPDPRPYDGLLQGAYSHLALADFFQRSALAATLPARRDAAWAQHARCQAQVGAVLPALVGSGDLTVRGRRFVDRMVEVYERLAEQPPPRGHAARATAYVQAARTLWNRRHAPGE